MKKLHTRALQIFNKAFFFQLSLRQTKFVLFLLIAALIYMDVRHNDYYAYNSVVAAINMKW